MKEHNCKFCSHLLFKGDLADIEIKCSRCKQFNNIKYFSQFYLTTKQEASNILSR